MQNRIKIIFLCFFVVFILSACATSGDPSAAYPGESSKQIFERGEAALKDKSYSEAIKRFEALDIQYPYSAENNPAQLYIIYAYYMKEDFALAAASADRYIRLHPTSQDAPYAYYMRGLSDYYQNLGVIERFFKIDLATRDLAQVQKAYRDFNELVTRFPDSHYVPAAHQYLVYLRNILARHELEVGQYYYHRKAYVAAANRGSDVVLHYQGSPAVVDALVLMAKSYHELHLAKQEQETVALLKYNYPNQEINF